MQITPVLMTIDQVAEMLQMTTRSVRRAWYAGLLPKPIRMGRRSIRWRREELEKFIANKRQIVKEHA